MPDERDRKESSEPDEKRPAEPGMAQVGNQKVPRPEKVSDRSPPDDVDE